jgi:DNA-binding transcriptional LysR family regulator
MMRRLEMAIAIDTHRSFSRAAGALGVSQPALTRALQTLEKEFGAQLFERRNAECEPTSFGRIVLARARRIVSEVAEARREIDLLLGLGAGEFRIAVGNASSPQWIGRAIGDLCAANPGLRVRNVEHMGHQQPDALMAGEIDVAVGELRASIDGYPDIVVARLPRRPGAFFCRPGHPLTKLAKVGIKDICAFPLAGPRLDALVGMHFPAVSPMGSMSANGRFFEPAVACANWALIRTIVARSDAVGIHLLALLNAPENRAEQVILPFAAPWLRSRIAIMWRRDRMAHPALKAFRDAVRRNEAIALGDKAEMQELARQGARPEAKVIEGAPPADLPVEQPTPLFHKHRSRRGPSAWPDHSPRRSSLAPTK